MRVRTDRYGRGISPECFISEAQAFREFVAKLSLSRGEKKQAYKLLVEHAAMLDPRARGYEGAGIALKEACSTWLECETDGDLRPTAEETSDH